MTTKPLVSVLITAYNAENLLSIAVKHLTEQTYRNIEIVVVEDGSKDRTSAIIKDLAAFDSRIKPFFPGRLGRAKALNFGLSKCQGEFVAVNDADDFSMPERIEKQVQFMNSHPEIGLLGSSKEIHEGKKVWRDKVPGSDVEIRQAFAYGQPIQHSTVMFRREVLNQVGGYNEGIPFLLDRDIFIRVARISKLHQLRDHLIILNRSKNQYFRNRYTGIQRSWMSTKYQLKAVWYFHLNQLLYIKIILKFLYSLLIQITKSNKNE